MSVHDQLMFEAREAQTRADLHARAEKAAGHAFREVPFEPAESHASALAFNDALNRVRLFRDGVSYSETMGGGYLTAETIEADLKLLEQA